MASLLTFLSNHVSILLIEIVRAADHWLFHLDVCIQPLMRRVTRQLLGTEAVLAFVFLLELLAVLGVTLFK